MIPLILTDLLGLYLALLFGFNKGFAYTFIWVGPLPLFISELVLGGLLVAFIRMVVRGKWHYEKKDLWIYIPLLIFWTAGLVAIWPVLQQSGGEMIDTLKRSALCYYSLFTFLVYNLFRDTLLIRRLLFWMFLGGLVCTMANFLVGFSWWPHYAQAGIAAISASMFSALYSFFRFDQGWRSKAFCVLGTLTSLTVFFTTIRSGFLVFLVTVCVVFFLFLSCGVPRIFIRHGATFLAFFFISAAISIGIWGAPPGLGRYQRLFHQMSEKKSPEQSRVKLNLKNEPVVPTQPSRSLHAGIIRGGITFLVIALILFLFVKFGARNPLFKTGYLMVPLAAFIFLLLFFTYKKSDFSGKSSAHEIGQVSVLDKIQLKIHTFFVANSEAGNVSWRLNVWLDGIKQVAEKSPLFGMGFSEPFIVQSMNPFTDPERYRLALLEMKKTYDFRDRISDPGRIPSADVVPRPPFKLTPEEQARLVSHHWYGIDFHNSIVAIFYRIGLIGLGGFIAINLFFLFGAWSLCQQRDLLAYFSVCFWVWYIGAASFNVVLEGPFMAVPFWVFIGLMMRYSRERQITSK
ncbi:MAG: hypothetical protein KCHDKBKB_01083 [Elusimicrobia bacterium]|nr:hypothetical protein [Elusimicrobiota bacterium]